MTYFVVTDDRLTVVQDVVTGLEILKERGRSARLENADGQLLASLLPANTWCPLDSPRASEWVP